MAKSPEVSNIDPAEVLDKLAAARERLAKYEQEKQTARDKILKPFQSKLDKIDREMDSKISQVTVKIGEMEQAVREYVSVTKEKVHGQSLQCIPVKDRVIWDDKKLEGMIEFVPQLAAARSTKPSTPQIRAYKGDEE